MISIDQINNSLEALNAYCKDKDPKPVYCQLPKFPRTTTSLTLLITTTTITLSGTNTPGTSTTTTI